MPWRRSALRFAKVITFEVPATTMIKSARLRAANRPARTRCDAGLLLMLLLSEKEHGKETRGKPAGRFEPGCGSPLAERQAPSWPPQQRRRRNARPGRRERSPSR